MMLRRPVIRTLLRIGGVALVAAYFVALPAGGAHVRLDYSPSKPLPADRFVYSPWEMTDASQSGVRLPAHSDTSFLYERFLEWTPKPKGVWRRTPDPRTIEFERATGLPFEKRAQYFFFRTTLNVPRSMDPRTVRLPVGADDAAGVYVNGSLAWQSSAPGVPQPLRSPVGEFLHCGRNSIVVVLADWYASAAMRAGPFYGPPDTRDFVATLPGDPWPLPPPRDPSHPLFPAERLNYPPDTRLPRSRFVLTPWEWTSAAHGAWLPIPSPHPYSPPDLFPFLRENSLNWVPPPDPRWRRASSPRTLDFYRKTDVPCLDAATYFYFRTTLNVPPDMDARSIRLNEIKVDDAQSVIVNGRRVDMASTSDEVPIGPLLHAGLNRVVVVLVDWCAEAALTGVRFIGQSGGSIATATLAMVTPTEPARLAMRKNRRIRLFRISDDWLRTRRDSSNSAHARVSLRLPLRPSWSVPYSVEDARIWNGVALLLTGRDSSYNGGATLIAFDLDTGREKWSLADVGALGDISDDGGAAIVATPGTPFVGRSRTGNGVPIVLLDVSTGRMRWRRDIPGAAAPLAIHGRVLYTFGRPQGGDGGLMRLDLANGAVLGPVAALDGSPDAAGLPGEWAEPAFTKDQLIFGGGHWLFALWLTNLNRGTRFYDGGSLPIVSDDWALTEGWYWIGQVFRREGKWLRKRWTARTGRDVAHAWLPGAGPGAVLLQYAPNDAPGSIALFNLSTGKPIWRCATTATSYAVSAGTQIAEEERRAGLAIRDSRTGRILWKSRTFDGRPLAASNGRILVSAKNKLWCMK